MTSFLEHCDDTVQGALGRQGPWRIVMTGVMGHCDDIDHLGIVMKGIMEHCDDWGHEALL